MNRRNLPARVLLLCLALTAWPLAPARAEAAAAAPLAAPTSPHMLEPVGPTAPTTPPPELPVPVAPPAPPAPVAQRLSDPEFTPAPTARAGNAPAAATAAPRRVPTMEPAAASAAAAAGEYKLTVSGTDVFPTNTEVATTVTLTRNGAPVPDAQIWIANWAQATTDALGQAHFQFQAPSTSTVLSLSVTTGDLQRAWMGELFIAEPGSGVVVVEQVTDRTGETILTDFLATFHDPTGWYSGRWSGAGRTGVILPANVYWGEIAATGGDSSFYLTQQVTVMAGSRVVLHPSASSTVQLQVSAELDGAPVPASVNLRSHVIPGEVPARFLSTTLYVTPGMYDVTTVSATAAGTVVLTGSTAVTADQAFTLAETTANLAQFRYTGTDGYGKPFLFEPMTLRVDQTLVMQGDASRPVFVAPNHTYNPLTHYETKQGMLIGWYALSSIRRNVTPAPGSITEQQVGGPLSVRVTPKFEQAAPGKMLTFGIGLFTSEGDRVEGSGAYRPEGKAQVKDSAGNVIARWDVQAGYAESGFGSPNLANGTYTLLVDYNLGSYQAPAHGEYPFTVTDPPPVPDYSLSVTPDIVPKGSGPVTITARLSNYGRSAPGVSLGVGWEHRFGTFTTDANGAITFTLPSGMSEQAIPIWGPGRYGGEVRLGHLFVLSNQFGAVTVQDVTDQDGQEPGWSRAVASSFLPSGTSFVHDGGFGPDDQWATVRPAGVSHIEVTSFPGTPSLYLYQQVAVQGGKHVTVRPSGAGARLLSTIATLDGSPLNGNLYLHNEQMEGPSQVTWAVGQQAYVTPGTYSLLFAANPTVMLYQEGVAVTTAKTVPFTAFRGGLAALDVQLRDGTGADLPAIWRGNLRVGAITAVIEHFVAGTRLVTPGVPYGLGLGRLSIYDGTQNWEYTLAPPCPDCSVTPLPGQRVPLRMGGPVHIELTSSVVVPRPGQDVTWCPNLVFETGGGLWWNQPQPFPQLTLRLRDSAGVAVWSGSGDLYLCKTIPTPAAPGTYTLEAELDVGPYQGLARGTQTFAVEFPAAVTLTPNHVASGVPTIVTAYVTRGGEPVVGETVSMGGNPVAVTDAQGKATFNVQEWGNHVYGVTVEQAGAPAVARLYVLEPGYAGLEIQATRADGSPFPQFLATAGSQANWTNDWSSDGAGSGLITAQSDPLVAVATGWDELYYLYRTVHVTPGTVTPVQFSATEAVPVPLTADLDGVPFAAGSVTLALEGENDPADGPGRFLSSSGPTTVHVTPGSYKLLIRGTAGGQPVLGLFRNQALNGAAKQLSLHRSDMAEFDLRVGFADLAPDVRVVLDVAGLGAWLEQTGQTLVTSERYTARYAAIILSQPGGDRWEYLLWNGNDITYVAEAGETTPILIDPTPAASRVMTTASHFTPGGLLEYWINTQSVSGWTIGSVYNHSRGFRSEAPISTRITDAAGVTVHSRDGGDLGWTGWPVPAEPSDRYTITMARDLGVLGVATAQTTVTRLLPVKITASREILPAGTITSVSIAVSEGSKPLQTEVQVFGRNGSQTYRTDSRGIAKIAIKSEDRPSVWRVCGGPGDAPGRMACTYLYTVPPGYGLVDVAATDAEGAQLDSVDFMALSAADGQGQGYHWQGEALKLILPAGSAKLIVRGRSASRSEIYYQVVDAAVSAGVLTAVAVDGAQTVPVTLTVANAGQAASGILYLHRSGAAYTENVYLGFDPRLPTTLRATPGTYEALMAVRLPGGRALLHGAINTAAGQAEFDLGAATAELDVTAATADARGADPGSATIDLGHGQIRAWLWLQPGYRLWSEPATYRIESVSFGVTDPDGRWAGYNFYGDLPVSLSAGTVTHMAVGGPLTLSIQAARTAVAGTRTAIGPLLRDRNGLIFQGGGVSSRLTVTGPGGYGLNGSFGDTTFIWDVPNATGTYSVHLKTDLPDYGQSLQADTTITVVRLVRP